MTPDAWLLMAFLLTPRTPEGLISMDSTVLGISRVYESERSCHAGAGQLQRRILEIADDPEARVAMFCVQGRVYGSRN